MQAIRITKISSMIDSPGSPSLVKQVRADNPLNLQPQVVVQFKLPVKTSLYCLEFRPVVSFL